MTKDLDKKLTIGIFLIFIGGFSIANALYPKSDYSANENRYLAKEPEVSVKHVFSGEFDTDFEKWFSDHFIGRDKWIETKAATRKASGAIENNSVYFADDDRLISQFFSYNPKIPAGNAASIEAFADSIGSSVNIMLVPTAAYGESDTLPYGAYNVDQEALIKEISAQLGNQNFIDLSDDLKNADDAYFKTDHHWNEKGAYIGYKAICDAVLHTEAEEFSYETASDSFSGTMYSKSGAFWTKADSIYTITAKDPVSVQVEYDDGTEADTLYSTKRLDEKDKYPYYLDGNHASVHITTDADTQKKAIIIKDSYAHILIPYLAEEYSDIEVIDLRYYHNAVSDLITDQDNTDIYFIYSLDNFCQDTNLAFLK